MTFPILLGQTNVDVRTFLEFSRWHQMTQWWHWMLLLTVCVLILGYVVWLYLRDNVEQRPGVATSLLLLRIVVFAGVLLIFLGLEQRGETQLVKDSRVVLLFDTSLSMGIHDASATDTSSTSRLQQVVNALTAPTAAEYHWLHDLRRQHHVIAYRFDQASAPAELVSLPKLAVHRPSPNTSVPAERWEQAVPFQRRFLGIAGAILASGLLFTILYAFLRTSNAGAWCLFVGVVFILTSLVLGAVVHLQFPEAGWEQWIHGTAVSEPSGPDEGPEDSSNLDAPEVEEDSTPPWVTQLTPLGTETRLGEALRYIVDKERGGAIAGIVVFTDGNSNAGLKPQTVATLAKSIPIPLFAVGLGSEKRPTNVRITDLQLPPRVFPGDAFTVSGYLQSTGLGGRNVRVQLLASPTVQDGESEHLEVIDERSVRLSDDEMVTVRFQVTPSSPGRYIYQLKLIPPPEDHREQDNSRQAAVRVVERNNQVLLIAGGPTREYRFARNLLFRDRHTSAHVWLQTGLPGMSQEADNVISDFPELPDDLFAYDAILAFDIDWTAFNRHQIALLERWVAEKAGGLVLVAGSVHTPEWTALAQNDERWSTIRALYPVVFYGESSAAFHLSKTESERAWPLQFTRDGQSAEFLWLDETSQLSEQAWTAFEGVYGFFATKQAKVGAQVYAYFSEPGLATTGELPVYLAGHFYGAGRVFFMASGEMWRLRAVDERYFEQFYTKLIRYVSQGRLLRDSSRGLLMVEKERCLVGDNVVIRAVLTDSQHQPLSDELVPAMLVNPHGLRQELKLRSTPQELAQAGSFTGQFTAGMEGDYRIELPVPDSRDEELLVREVRARLPDLEVGRPERDDATLKQITQATGGMYYVGMDTIAPSQGKSPLVGAILPQDQVTFIPGAADQLFDRVFTFWLLAFICTALCMEWLLRRLHRLA